MPSAVSDRPVTAVTTFASALVVVANRAGLDLSVEEALSLVSAIAIAVGWFTPRRRAAR